jgi:hypothetical protein
MLIRIGYNIALRLASPTAVLYLLHVHPSRKGDLAGPENFRIEPPLPVEDYFDGFGNHCGRVNAPAGVIRFSMTQSFAILANRMLTNTLLQQLNTLKNMGDFDRMK